MVKINRTNKKFTNREVILRLNLLLLFSLCVEFAIFNIQLNKIEKFTEIKNMSPIVIEENLEQKENEELEITFLKSEDNQWWSDEELELLARLIYCEAGSDEISDEHQQLVAQVVINRVNDGRFPNTISEVIYQKGQYACVGNTRWDSKEVPERCYNNALKALNGEVQAPENLIFQANFEQGTEIYKIFKTSYSVTYFCKG